jgi:hypothetical protein
MYLLIAFVDCAPKLEGMELGGGEVLACTVGASRPWWFVVLLFAEPSALFWMTG